MDSATRLINSLSNERKRWTNDSRMINEKKKQLIGNVALCCAFMTYCGPFNAEYRT
jgi:dynein heavy chain